MQRVAHRGFAKAAPENTMAGFRLALQHKPDVIELDVRATSDGRIIVMHDAAVDRTTNGTGKVAEMTFDEIRSLDAGSWFGPQFAGEKVPTLEEVLELTHGRTVLHIEIKAEGIEDKVAGLIADREMEDEVVMISFHHGIGARLPSINPKLRFLAITSPDHEMAGEEAAALVQGVKAMNASIVSVQYKAITPSLLDIAHAAGLELCAWTLDEADLIARYTEMGADFICSNDIALLNKVVGFVP